MRKVKVVSEELYAKFPNNFFYDCGNLFERIGGKDSFLIYSLFTSRKNMLNKVHITIKDIMETLKLDSNSTRSKNRIAKGLKSLIEFEYIQAEQGLDEIRVTDTLVFQWLDRFSNRKSGWIPFYASDFEIYDKIGATAYILMWLLRMFRNNKTGNSYPSVETMSATLKVSNTTIQNCTELFSESGLFEIDKGDYYYHKDRGQYMRYNNTYKYSGKLENVLIMDSSTITKILQR